MTNRIDRLLVCAAIVPSMAFLLRVIGQAVQRWTSQPWLPPFDAWQGSGMPYDVLLVIHVAILVLQACVLTPMAQGRRMMGLRASRALIALGAGYFAVMALRLLVGLAIWTDTHWFTSWISIAFHLALATIIMLWGWRELRVGHRASSFPEDVHPHPSPLPSRERE